VPPSPPALDYRTPANRGPFRFGPLAWFVMAAIATLLLLANLIPRPFLTASFVIKSGWPFCWSYWSDADAGGGPDFYPAFLILDILLALILIAASGLLTAHLLHRFKRIVGVSGKSSGFTEDSIT
jgi:Zn-dependent protease